MERQTNPGNTKAIIGIFVTGSLLKLRENSMQGMKLKVGIELWMLDLIRMGYSLEDIKNPKYYRHFRAFYREVKKGKKRR